MTITRFIFDLPDDTKQVTRTCGKCGVAHTDTDRGFAALGWGLLRRRLLCPVCMPQRYSVFPAQAPASAEGER